ncbi:MAG: hypothetical protein OXI07_09000 [Gammaproteobacteria bacterium]|nr:hypothetical protein [Gammaproteobacteria bacterium]
MARLSVALEGNAIAFLNTLSDPRQVNRIIWRAMTRAQTEIGREYTKTLRQNIRARTVRRTGSLLRSKIKKGRDRGTRTVSILPDFPRTAYVTAPGRGRRGASKQGQYAFVLEASKHFIADTTREWQESPRLQAIFNRHLAFIINEVIEKS